MKKGFTLIELLVVVLIIGILAAVALPQYETAVGKARVAALLPLLRAVDSAEKVYLLANGEYSMSFDKLDISMPPGGTLTPNGGKDSLKYGNFSCWFQQNASKPTQSSSIYCAQEAVESRTPYIEKYFSVDDYICWADVSNASHERICRAISGKTTCSTATTSSRCGYSFRG